MYLRDQSKSSENEGLFCPCHAVICPEPIPSLTDILDDFIYQNKQSIEKNFSWMGKGFICQSSKWQNHNKHGIGKKFSWMGKGFAQIIQVETETEGLPYNTMEF